MKNLAIFIDMDNPILIILIVIGSVIYKIYQGYQEEQEKAKKRMEQLKKQLQTENPFKTPPAAVPQPAKAKPVQKPTLVSHQKPVEIYSDVPTYDEVEMVRQRKLEQQRRAAEKRLKEERQKAQSKPMEVESLDVVYHFNLRQAIIQQAVLERPYKD